MISRASVPKKVTRNSGAVIRKDCSPTAIPPKRNTLPVRYATQTFPKTGIRLKLVEYIISSRIFTAASAGHQGSIGSENRKPAVKRTTVRTIVPGTVAFPAGIGLSGRLIRSMSASKQSFTAFPAPQIAVTARKRRSATISSVPPHIQNATAAETPATPAFTGRVILRYPANDIDTYSSAQWKNLTVQNHGM